MTAWLRLGKLAVFSILAGLAVAVGMALPEGKDAEAQGILSGYSYTQRYCQEYGQQPRYQYVRDPIPGSDWRNDGGWAIVQERGAYTSTWVRNDADGDYAIDLGISGRTPERLPGYQRLLRDANGNPQRYDRTVQVNAVYSPNNSGYFARIGPGETDYDFIRIGGIFNPGFRRYDHIQSGGQYIRWANLAWCR